MNLTRLSFYVPNILTIAIVLFTKQVVAGPLIEVGAALSATGEPASDCDSSIQRQYYQPTDLSISTTLFTAPSRSELQQIADFEERIFKKTVKTQLGTNAVAKRIPLTNRLADLGYVIIFVGNSTSPSQSTQFESLVIKSQKACWLRIRASSKSNSIPPQQQLYQLMRVLDFDSTQSMRTR